MGNAAVLAGGKIKCCLCSEDTHAIQVHLKDKHPEVSLDAYRRDFPNAPLLSSIAERKVQEKLKASMATTATATVTPLRAGAASQVPMHELFQLGSVPAAMNSKGGPVPISVLEAGAWADMVPQADPDYVFDIEVLKSGLMGVELNIPSFSHGHSGTGKTTLWEQIAARTNRPYMRVQHTLGMEEADVLGQWVVIGGETVFQPGPVPLAMRHGWLYCADEYDYGLAGVTGVYQPVLEGKSLVIKNAPEEWRVVKPHPQFRFVATGNTNGSGDDTGLYQGTQLGNAANYERFGIMLEVRYMAAALEAQMLVKKAGIAKQHADRLVEFATKVRESYMGGKISHTISPRTLIYAAKLGIRRGSWRLGVTLAFTNRLSRVDRETVDQLAQRMFDAS